MARMLIQSPYFQRTTLEITPDNNLLPLRRKPYICICISNLIIIKKERKKMKTPPRRLTSEKENDSIKGYVNFTPEFTRSEKITLRRLGYAPLPGSTFLYSSDGKWIEKVERVDYVIKHDGTKLYGVIETNRVLTYLLVEKLRGSYSGLTTTIAEGTDFKSFVKKIKNDA
jgi:hypothetical protein